jgi:hypothetical protein
MRSLRRGLFISIVAAVFLTASLPALGQEDRWVDADVCPGTGTGAVDDPMCTIQEAICELKDVLEGGTVHVLPGTYNEAIRFFPRVSVVSTDGPAVTTIDATGQYCYTSECALSSVTPCTVAYFPTGSANVARGERLEGFHLTGGGGLNQICGGSCDIMSGAGIFILNSSPTITNNEVVGNTLVGDPKVYYGGGIYVHASLTGTANAIITQNLIEYNVAMSPPGQNQNDLAFSLGGGIYVGYNAGPLIEGNTIRNNTAGANETNNQIATGGGIALYSKWNASQTPVISRNVISSNFAADAGGGVQVGYAAGYAPTNVLIENNLIEYNDSADGGGVTARWSRATIRNNTFANNLANAGAAISAGYTGYPNDQVTIANNLMLWGDATAMPGGGAIYVYYSDPVVLNNDMFGNVPENVAGEKSDGDYIGFDGNISEDPLVVSSTAPRDLQLQAGSPAIEAGTNDHAGLNDLDAVPRVQDADWDGVATVDMGAYEYSADYDGDAIPDWEDLDDDDDGVPDDIDCADFSPSVTTPPGNVPNLEVTQIGAGTKLKWDRAFQGHTSNIYRGSVDTYFSDTCLFSEQPSRTVIDTDDPPAGAGFYYLASARNGCGESESAVGQMPPLPCGEIQEDTDGDGFVDVLDNCAAVANADQADLDGDWVGDEVGCDNCVGLTNVDQADTDEDTFGDLCDCAPADPLFTDSLPMIQGLVVEPGIPTMVQWDDLGQSIDYEVAKGLVSTLRAEGSIASADCPAGGGPNSSWHDMGPEPDVGEVYYYVVRAVTGMCEGGFGSDSSGHRQVPTTCM